MAREEALIMELHPIDTAPKDGTWVLLFGGRTNEEEGEVAEADITRPVVGAWNEDVWTFAHWDSGWGGSYYDDPTHWLSLDALPTPPAKVEG